MSTDRATPNCRDDGPRRRQGAPRPPADPALPPEPGWNGIDAVEVERLTSAGATLRVYLIRRLTEPFLKALQAAPDALAKSLAVTGGPRAKPVHVNAVTVQTFGADATDDDYLEVTVTPPGDFSRYTLALDESRLRQALAGREDYRDRFDPFYARAEFTFRPDCPTGGGPGDACAPAPDRPEPVIDYLARDYGGFRQLLFDRLALVAPGWKERHVPDLGVALVELLAYVGDHLSYYQDAVATEAYLGTARLRTSVRRHVRLIDYPMHDGCNARAWVWVEVTAPGGGGGQAPRRAADPRDPAAGLPGHADLPATVVFLTGEVEGVQFGAGRLVPAADWQAAPPGAVQAFEVLASRGKAPWLPSTAAPRQREAAVAAPTAGADKVIRLFSGNGTIPFYTWGNQECCLPCGSTRAALCGKLWQPPDPTRANPECDPNAPGPDVTVLYLRPDDFLIFEETVSPQTGRKAEADPTRRHVVRLTEVTPGFDPVEQRHYVEIAWDPRDALPFALCLSAVTPYRAEDMPRPDATDPCDDPPPPCPHQVTAVAHGNVFLVDHGTTLRTKSAPGSGGRYTEDLGPVPQACDPPDPPCLEAGRAAPVVRRPRTFRPTLTYGPLTRRQPLPTTGDHPAAGFTDQDPCEADPQIRLRDEQDGPDPGLPGDRLTWVPHRDLLASGPQDRHFVAEAEDDGTTRLRFGDGVNGRQPAADMTFRATYRVGNGTAGNVGAEAITHIGLPVGYANDGGGYTFKVHNPFPARGGVDPEPLEDVRRLAPDAFAADLRRVVVPDDYVRVVGRRFAEVQRAAAVVRPSGGRDTVTVLVDFYGRVPDGRRPGLLTEITTFLAGYRQIGQRVVVREAESVPLDVEVRVTLRPDALRGPATAALRDALSSRALADGRRGFFHPDNLTFGQSVAKSRLVAAAQAVPGVESVEVTRLRRLGRAGGPAAPEFLAIGPLEIARLDDDPNRPGGGRLRLDVRGGR